MARPEPPGRGIQVCGKKHADVHHSKGFLVSQTFRCIYKERIVFSSIVPVNRLIYCVFLHQGANINGQHLRSNSCPSVTGLLSLSPRLLLHM